MNPRIKYILNFSLIGLKDSNAITFNNYKKEYYHESPIEARKACFNEFSEVLNDLAANDRLSHIDGKLLINQATEKFEKFEEELKIEFIYDQEMEEMGYEQNESATIHQVTSYDFDPQKLLDNLYLEYIIYNENNFDTANLDQVVEFYGTDYLDSGMEPEAAFTKVLKTPFEWQAYNDFNPDELAHENHFTVRDLIDRGEGNQIEFKPTLLYNFKTKAAGISVKYILAKTICAFLNTSGGFLLIGVDNSGNIKGLEYDFSLFADNHKDRFRLELDNLISTFFSISITPFIESDFFEIDGKMIYWVKVLPSDKPIFLINKSCNRKEFYIRMEASTRHIEDVEELIDYVRRNWKST